MERVAIEVFRDHIDNIIDPDGIHHELSQGWHGQKIDFDEIPLSSPLFDEWVDISAHHIQKRYRRLPKFIVGVAEGTNRLAVPLAKKLGGGVIGLMTKKISRSEVELTPEAHRAIAVIQPELVVVKEDVGTRGTNSSSAAKAALEAGAQNVEVINTFQRSETLEVLDAEEIAYASIIKEILPTYEPAECVLCAKRWELIPYNK